MSVQFGSTTKQKPQTTTVTRQVAPPSAEEALLNQRNIEMAQRQNDLIQQAMQAQQAYEQSPAFAAMNAVGNQGATNWANEMSGNAPVISPQQQAMLQQYFDSIMKPQLDMMRQGAVNDAQRRGLAMSDSPAAAPYYQNVSNYLSQMGGQQAGQALNMQANNRQMYQNAATFGSQLQNNANANRLALASTQPAGYGLSAQLANQRIASAPQTQTTSGGSITKGPSFGVSGADLSGAGNFLWGSTPPAGRLGGLLGRVGWNV